MSEDRNGTSALEMMVGLLVVIFASFLGLCNIKANNLVQQMTTKQSEYHSNWAWYQARNIRSAIYEQAGKHDDAKDQQTKMEELKTKNDQLEKDISVLSKKDDQFDLAEAGVGLGLAILGIAVILKRWWMLMIALIPAGFGMYLGVAGFLSLETDHPAIDWALKLLT